LGLWIVIASVSADAVVLAEGDWVITDPDANAVYRVDSTTFDIDEISSDGEFRYPTGVTVAAGEVFVADPDANAIIRVNPVDGAQVIVSEHGLLVYPTGLGVASNGDLLVADPVARLVVRVDPSDGSQSVEYAMSPTLFATDVFEAPNPLLFATDPVANLIVEIDPLIPLESPFSSGPIARYPTGGSAEASDDLLVADPDLDAILRVDGDSGRQTLELDGTGLLYPTDIQIVPEPTLGPLLLTGSALLALFVRHRERMLRAGRQRRCARPA
jgi:hypothetical protein